MAADDLFIRMGADISGLLRGMKDAQRSTADTASGIKSECMRMNAAFEGVQAAVGLVSRAFMAIGSILAGGAMFKDVVDTTVRVGNEQRALSQRLGLTIDAAGALRLALHNTGIEVSTYSDAVTRLTNRLLTKEKAFEKAGIAVRDSNGHLRDANSLMVDTIEKLKATTAGSERNALALQLLGIRGQQLTGMLRLNKEEMREAAEEYAKFGVHLDPETIHKYEKSVSKLTDTIEAMKLSMGPTLIAVLEKAAVAFAKVFQALFNVRPDRSALEEYLAKYMAELEAADQELAAAQARSAAPGNTVIERWVSNWFGDVATAKAKVQHLRATIAEILRELEHMPKAAPPAAAPAGEDAPDLSGAKTDIWLAGQKTALERLQDKDIGGFTPEQITAYWQRVMAAQKPGSEHYLQALHELREAQRKWVEGMGHDFETGIKADEAATRRLEEDAKLKRQVAGIELDAARAHGDALAARKLEDARFGGEAGIFSAADQAREEQRINDEKYASDRAYVMQKLGLAGLEVEERARINAQLQALDDGHALQVQQTQHRLQLNTIITWKGILAPIQSAISTSIQGIILGTTTVKKALANLWVAVLAEFVNFLTQLLMKWILTQIAMLIFGKATEEAESKTKAAGAAGQITASAGVAGAAFAAVLAWLGPEVAIPAGAAMSAAVMATFLPFAAAGALASAARGWDVPADSLVRVHKKEMILPADLSEGIRDRVRSGGAGGGGITVHFHGVVDAKSWWNRNQSHVVRVLKNARRDGALVPA